MQYFATRAYPSPSTHWKNADKPFVLAGSLRDDGPLADPARALRRRHDNNFFSFRQLLNRNAGGYLGSSSRGQSAETS